MFFDTRLMKGQMATDEEIAAKQARIMGGAPLRLAFTGRLERMKGADDLIKIATALDRGGTHFSLDIYGAGSLASEMKAALNHPSASGTLSKRVFIHEPVDFNNELVPKLRTEVDLFLCCHRQSDPSCTYLETLGCGVPLLGYGNRALAGILNLADVGWMTSMNAKEEIIRKIVDIDANRLQLAKKMKNAQYFARTHSFESEFKSRVDHLWQLAKHTKTPAGSSLTRDETASTSAPANMYTSYLQQTETHFAEIAAVSIATLRLVSPHARIAVLTDRQTSSASSPGVAAIRDGSDDFVAIDCPGTDPLHRSRFLKTGMRGLTSGRFLYLDSDTIIMKSLDALWSIDCDIAASLDVTPKGESHSNINASFEAPALPWPHTTKQYLNAGVIYFADSQAAYAVGEEYSSGWSQFLKTTGKANDQPSFNRAAHIAGARLNILPSSYNAQISMNPLLLRGAKIVHFFTKDLESRDDTIAHIAAKRLKREGILDKSALQSAIASGNPWTRIDSYRKAVAVRHYARIGTIAFSRLRERVRQRLPTAK